MVIDVSQNFGRQPIKHVMKTRKSRTMYCDCCNPVRRLVFHSELDRTCCPATGQTPKILQDKIDELNRNPDPGTSDTPTIVTADGFTSGGAPVNVTSMKMRAKYGPRHLTTIDTSEFGPIDEDTKQMLENNPDYRLVDYREKVIE